MAINRAGLLSVVLTLLFGTLPATAQDPESYAEARGNSYVDFADVEMAMTWLYEIGFELTDSGALTEDNSAQLFAMIDNAYGYLLERREFWGQGGPSDVEGDAGSTYYYQVQPRAQLYISASAAGNNPDRALTLMVDEEGNGFVSAEQADQFSSLDIAMEEGWEEDYDQMMQQIEGMLAQFMETHAVPVEQEPVEQESL